MPGSLSLRGCRLRGGVVTSGEVCASSGRLDRGNVRWPKAGRGRERAMVSLWKFAMCVARDVDLREGSRHIRAGSQGSLVRRYAAGRYTGQGLRERWEAAGSKADLPRICCRGVSAEAAESARSGGDGRGRAEAFRGTWKAFALIRSRMMLTDICGESNGSSACGLFLRIEFRMSAQIARMSNRPARGLRCGIARTACFARLLPNSAHPNPLANWPQVRRCLP